MREFAWRRRLATALVLSVAGCSPGSRPAPVLPPAKADHHLHIQGPAATAAVWRLLYYHPLAVLEVGLGVMEPRTGADVLARLDEAGIARGVLLSEAYLLSSPLGATPAADVARLTRQENAYNVNAALASHGRLIAFVSVNPFDEGAVAELRFWAGRKGVAGIKLHLANSGFSMRSRAQSERLSAVLDECRARRMPLVVHVKNKVEYGPDDARFFVREFLPHVGDMPIQIAHLGDWGGLDRSTVDVLRIYAEAITKGAPGTKQLVFDLSCLACGWRSIDRNLAREFVSVMRKIGLNRFVMGSDWPAMSSIDQENRELESELPLTPAEWKLVLDNVAPYLPQSTSR